MARHISKMEDGHYIIETDEEYKKRTGGGCLSTILGVIVVGAIILAVGGNDNEESSTSSTAPTQQQSSVVETPKENYTPVRDNRQSVETATKATYESEDQSGEGYVDRGEDVYLETEDDLKSNSPSADEVVDATLETSSENTREQIKEVLELYDSAIKLIKADELDAARLCLEKMQSIQSGLPKKSVKVDERVKKLTQKLE